MSIPEDILKHAIARDIMIATAESCTAGMVAAALTDIPGSSAMMDRGFVTYTNGAKMDMLGVKPVTLADFGAVSEETACEMALGALQNSAATLTVAVTGIAGPGGSDFKPEGRVCFAVATTAGVRSETVEFGALGRATVRARSKDHALTLLLSSLTDR